MTRRDVLLVGMIALSSACAGCKSDDPPAEARLEIRQVARVDPGMQRTAAEFTSRLSRYDGQLVALTREGDVVDVVWTSNKCDSYEPEVVDLLISLHRTVTDSPTIGGQRICGAQTHKFKIAGSRFQQYRTGKINDPQILADIK